MRIITTAALAMMAAAVSALGQEAERELRQLEDQIAEAVVRRDSAFVERVWAEEFVYTGVRGEVKSKADIVAELKTGDLQFDVLKFDDVREQVYGDAAVATGRATTKGRSPQGEISGEFRYTRVYVKRRGAWQLVAFQGTPLASAK
jgi:ketosteroid isomerase-like protein